MAVLDLATLSGVNLNDVNQSPVISGFDGRVIATEDGPSIILDSDAIVTDADSANFASGTLTAEVLWNAEVGDRLSIRSFGNTPGKIGVSGDTVKYGGVVFGTFTNTSKLVVRLNSRATPQITQELIRDIAFSTTAIATTIRTIQMTLTDGDGGSTQVSKTVRVIGSNVGPAIGAIGPQATLNFPSATTGVFITQTATVRDPDSRDFNNGRFVVSTMGARTFDILSVNDDISDYCHAVGPNIFVGGVMVGYQSGGQGIMPLVVNFNANATIGVVQTVLRNVKWNTVPPAGEAPAEGLRTIPISLTDGDGGYSNLAIQKLLVTVVKLPSVVNRLGQSLQYPIGSTGILVAANAYVTPGYTNTSFDGGKLTITTGLNGEVTDRFFFRPVGNGVGQINVTGSTISYGGLTMGTFTGGDGLTPLVVTFNANANATSIGATLRRLTWKSTSATPSTSPRTFSVTVSDSNGTLSSPVQKRIVVV